MMHLLLIHMTVIPLDMIQTEVIQLGEPKAIRLLFKISTSHCFEQYPHYQQYQPSAGYCFYSTPIRKSKGTSYCSMNSKSFYCSQPYIYIYIYFNSLKSLVKILLGKKCKLSIFRNFILCSLILNSLVFVHNNSFGWIFMMWSHI